MAFEHGAMGRVARRAGAAVKAATEGPRGRLQSIASELATTVSALREYIEAGDEDARHRALTRAEGSLEAATHPSRSVVDIESLTYDRADALARARRLSGEVEGMLRGARPDFGRARQLLEEALGLVEHALATTGPSR